VRWSLLIAACLAALLLAGCGPLDSESSSEGASSTFEPGPSPTAVPFTAGPYSVDGDATSQPNRIAVLTNVRLAAHTEEGGFDRIVFEFQGTQADAQVEYQQGMFDCGSGAPVQLEGGNLLSVRFSPANAHDNDGNVTVNVSELAGTGRTVAEARQTCDFEAVVTWAVGAKERKPFRVTTLKNPSRIVIDVRH
jgi:hypothetical protein